MFLYIIFPLFGILFTILGEAHGTTYYTSPSASILDASLCTLESVTCKLSHLLTLKETNITIRLLKGQNEESYSSDVNNIRSFPTDHLILDAEEGASFDPDFFIWVNESVSRIEMNNFHFPQGTNAHIHPQDGQIDIYYILYVGTSEKTQSHSMEIKINKLVIDSDSNSNTVVRALGMKGVQIHFQNSELNYIDSPIGTSSPIIGHTFSIDYGGINRVYFDNCTLKGLKGKLFEDDYLLKELQMDHCKINLNSTMISATSQVSNPPSIFRIHNTIIEGNCLTPFINVTGGVVESLHFENVTAFGNFALHEVHVYQTQDITLEYINSKINLPSSSVVNLEKSNSHMYIKIENSEFSSTSQLDTIFQSKYKSTVNIMQSSISMNLVISSGDYLSLSITDCEFHHYGNILKATSITGIVNIQNSIFKNFLRGPKFQFKVDESVSEVLVRNCTFRDSYDINEMTGLLIDRMGAALFAQATIVKIQSNRFENITFTSKAVRIDLLNSKFGVVGIHTLPHTAIEIQDNVFHNTKADIGGAFSIWYNDPHTIRSIIERNRFLACQARIGSAIALYAPQQLRSISISENLFNSCTMTEKAVIYLQTIFQITNIDIQRNRFIYTDSPSQMSNIICFEGGNFINLNMSDNSFQENAVTNEIFGNVNQLSGAISNSNFGILIPTIFANIRLLATYVQDFTINNITLEDNSKPLLEVNSIYCENFIVKNIQSLNGIYMQIELWLLNVVSSYFGIVRISDIKTNRGLNIVQTTPLSFSDIQISNVDIDLQYGNMAINLKNIIVAIYDSKLYTSIKFNTNGNNHLLNLKNCDSILQRVTIGPSPAYNQTKYGCIYSEGDKLQIINSNIGGCKSSSGGAIYSLKQNYVIIENSNIMDSTSDQDGGCLFMSEGVLTLRNTTFKNCLSGQDGGGLTLLGSIQEISNCKFTTCSGDTGGGIFLGQSATSFNISNVEFSNCTARTSGGGMWVFNDIEDLKEAYFRRNTLSFHECSGGYADEIGSIPTRIELHEDSVTSVNYFEIHHNSKYAIIGLRSPYGLLRPFLRDGLTMLRADKLELKTSCHNDIGQLREHYFCIKYEYSITFRNSETKFLIQYDKLFHGVAGFLEHVVVLQVAGYWIYFALVSVIIMIVSLIIFSVMLLVFIIIVMLSIIAHTRGKRALYADLELSLLRKKIDQDMLIDGGDIVSSFNNIYQIRMSDLEIKEKVGTGGSGAYVMRAVWKEEELAIKLFRGSIIESMQQEFENEISLLSSLYHPNIVRFAGVIIEPPRYGIAMEFCPGSVSRLIQSGNSKKLSWNQKLTILYQIVSAMEYLAKRDIIHRDLKWENVLLSVEGDARLTDLGLSRRISEATQNLTARIGTSYLIAPEVVKGLNYDWRCDVFSLGIMIYELLTNKLGPLGITPGIEFQIANNANFRPDLSKVSLSSNKTWILSLMQRCWSDVISERPSFTEIRDLILQHTNNLQFE